MRGSVKRRGGKEGREGGRSEGEEEEEKERMSAYHHREPHPGERDREDGNERVKRRETGGEREGEGRARELRPLRCLWCRNVLRKSHP